MKLRRYLLNEELKYSKEERNAFMEKVRNFGNLKSEIYRSKRLAEISEELGSMITEAEVFTLKETDEWFDKPTVSRDMKDLKTSFKIFEQTSREIGTLQQRLEACYENIGHKLSRYYDV